MTVLKLGIALTDIRSSCGHDGRSQFPCNADGQKALPRTGQVMNDDVLSSVFATARSCRFWGIDSGERHSVGGDSYGLVRAGEFSISLF